jgi:hypothetical protein
MKIKAQISFIAIHHVFASLVFGTFMAIGIYLTVQGIGIGGVVMASLFGLFFLIVQVLAILYYIKAERFPVGIENDLVTIRSFKGGKTASFPTSEVSSWGFIFVRNGGKGISFFTKDGRHHVASPIVMPSPEDRAKLSELIGIEETERKRIGR